MKVLRVTNLEEQGYKYLGMESNAEIIFENGIFRKVVISEINGKKPSRILKISKYL